MARLDWTTFLATHPQAHLLAGHVPEPNPAVLKRLRRLMQALIDGEAPVGDYATAIVRRRDITEIQCGFADRSDAERVGARLRAKSVPPSGDWLSERTPAARRANRGRAGRRDGRPQDGRPQADVTSRPCRPRTGLEQPRRGPGGGLRAGLGRRSSITDHAKTHPIWNCWKTPYFADLRAFPPGRQRPARPAGAVRSTVDMNKGDPGRPGAH